MSSTMIQQAMSVTFTGKQPYIGVDSIHDPFWEQTNELAKEGGTGAYGSLMPAEYLLSVHQKRAAWLNSPKGFFIADVAVRDAMRNGYRYVEYDNPKQSVDKENKKKLRNVNRKFGLKAVHTEGQIAARVFGRAIAFRIRQSGRSQSGKPRPTFKWRVTPIEDVFITYDESKGGSGEPIFYNPVVLWGKGMRQMKLKPKDVVLYVHKRDVMGNGYMGVPELLPIYNQLKWMINIERGWAEAMDARGISMIQVAIEGFELEDHPKWEKQYGNPASYNVMFTNKETDVTPVPGVSSNFNLDNTNDAFTKDAASASGMAMSRIDGTQRGQVTGSQTDTDNYYSILAGIQEAGTPQLIELFWKSDDSLYEEFDIAWDIEPKMDKQKKAQIFGANMSAIQSGLDFLTYNQALEILDFDPVPEGDVIASVYIYKTHEAAGMLEEEDDFDDDEDGPGEGAEDDDSKDKKGDDDKPSKMKSSTRKSQPKIAQKGDDGRANKKGKDEKRKQCRMRLASGRQCLNTTLHASGLCAVHRKGKAGGEWGSKKGQAEAERKGKQVIAKKLKQSGDSYRAINDILNKLYGSGLSNTDIRILDEEIRTGSINTDGEMVFV